MTIIECLQALLHTLPRCHGCDQPATRMMMSEHVPIASLGYGLGGYPIEHGKNFVARGYTGCSAGAQFYTPTDGTWQWECCDEHPMPESMKPYGSWDHKLAPVIRRAQTIIRTADRNLRAFLTSDAE